MKQECADAIQQAAGRQLSKAELDGIEERIRGALRELSMTDEANFLSMPPNERYAAAANLAKEWMLRDTVRAHEQALTEASRKAKLFADTAAVKPGLKGQVHYLKNELVNIEQRTNAVSANFFRQLQGLHEADGGKLFGMFQDPAKQRDIARGLFGEPTTPEAKRAADSIKQLMNTVAERFQRAGLTLNKREDYRTPQPQDPMKASSAGKEQWVNDHMQWADRRAYVNADGTRMSDDQLRSMLEESWRSIATDGANKRGEAPPSGGSALVGGNKNAPRQLFFKNSDAWSQAMQKYGRTSNMYELLGAHVRGMSKDIAMAETFGRQADKNYKQALAQAYEADHGTLSGEKDFRRLDTLRNKTERLFDAYVNPERPQNAGVANAMANLRGLIASTQLGSLFGALPDLAGIKMAANYSGLPAMRVFRNLVDGMAAGAEKKDFLHKLGVWQEGFQHMQHRVVEDGLNNGWGNWLNELTHRMMGLNAFDRGMRSGIGRTVMDTLGKFTREHDTLASAEGEARMLQRRGVTEDHWAVWKKAELDKGYSGNERLLTPQAIYDIKDPSVTLQMKDAAAEKLLEVAYGEMQYGARGASPSTVEDKVMLGTDKYVAGTVAGELNRFMLQFKSVPLGVFRQQWEAAKTLDGWGAKTAYMAKFAAYSMMMGALATEIKALINGQNPRNMNPDTPEGRKFWMESLAAGGGLGIYGDLFANGQTAAGAGLETLFGPGFSAMSDLVKEARQAVTDAENGESKHPYALKAVQWVRRNATPLMNLWYLKAAFNRLVYDNIQDTLAPGTSDKQRQRMEMRGASYWWAPGANSEMNTPDLSKAFE
ncbi:hypothetical protein [Ensifer adhaerens]|uniref:hypothetical protein n=1 Tax=Ensifer adhaerens TaxID=106592 RepID=UPI000CF1377E|nr:hypothetical protein [Ensifer adhaerens]